jgi:hypothetical protein
MGPALPALSLDLPCFVRPTALDQPVLLDVDLVLVQPARPPLWLQALAQTLDAEFGPWRWSGVSGSCSGG